MRVCACFLCECECVSDCVCVRARVNVRVHIYIHNTYLHTYIHTYIHALRWASAPSHHTKMREGDITWKSAENHWGKHTISVARQPRLTYPEEQRGPT